jgi:tripartite-type tricarboxylate transporter receptor subunit TctC
MSTRAKAAAKWIGFAGGASFSLVAPAFAAQAIDYPNRPVRVLVGFNPGGGTDITARVVGDALTRRLGQSFIIDNRPAQGGVLARRLAAEASPDGHTLLMVSGSQTIGAALVYKEPVDVRKTYAAVSLLTVQPYLMVTHPSVPAKNVQEFIAFARSKPGALNYGSTGVGSMAHLASELFSEMAKVKLVHVPYKGSGPGIVDLIRGQIQLFFPSATAGMPHVHSGKLRLLAASSKERSEQLPDVPTVAESGLPGFDVTGWYALIAPARTPPAIIEKLNREIGDVLKLPAVREKMAADGADARHSTPQQLAALIEEEGRKWTMLVKSAGIVLK